MTGDESERTRGERRILEEMVERRSEEWAERHAELVLAQARLVGDL